MIAPTNACARREEASERRLYARSPAATPHSLCSATDRFRLPRSSLSACRGAFDRRSISLMASVDGLRRALDDGSDSALLFSSTGRTDSHQPPSQPARVGEEGGEREEGNGDFDFDFVAALAEEEKEEEDGLSSESSDGSQHELRSSSDAGGQKSKSLPVMDQPISPCFRWLDVRLFLLLLFAVMGSIAVYQHRKLKAHEALLERHSITEETLVRGSELPPAAAAAAATAISRWVRHFLRLQERFQPLCGLPAQNRVINRRDATNADAAEEKRQWSFHPKAYHTHMESDESNAPPLTDAALSERRLPNRTSGEELWANVLPYCSTPEQLLTSVKDGIRTPFDQAIFASVSEDTGFNPVQHLSFFTPHLCNFRWFTSDQLCRVLSSFASLQWEGDSLVRHTVQALLMLLTDDVQYGGFPRGSASAAMLQLCRCDGAFSEAKSCRIENTFGFGLAMSPSTAADPTVQAIEGGWEPSPIRGYCNRLPSLAFDPTLHLSWSAKGWNKQADQLCTNASLQHPLTSSPSANANAAATAAAGVGSGMDTRPIFAYISSGTHDRTNADANIARLSGQLQTLQRLKVACTSAGRKLLVLYGGQGHMTRALEAKYPHQSDAGFRAFDSRVQQLLKANYTDLDVSFIYWGALSTGAPTSDGFHFLTEPNVIRVQYIANWLALQIGLELKEDDEDLAFDPGRR